MTRVLRMAVAVVALVAAAGAGTASAQWRDSLGTSWNNPGSALLGTMINNRLLAEAARKAANRKPATPARREPGARAGTGTRAGAGGPAAVEAPEAMTFRPVARNLMNREIAQTLTNDAKARRELVSAFEVYLKEFDDQARKDREPSYDVGRAAAFFVMVNYFAATRHEPNDAQADGAQAIFRSGLAESDTFARMNDRDRQRLYESLVILGSFPVHAATQSAQEGDEEHELMYREFAAELVKTLLGVPVDQIKLTKTGFRIDE